MNAPGRIRAVVAFLTVTLVGCTAAEREPARSPTGGAASTTSSDESTRDGSDRLTVEVVTDDLEHGWDVGFLPDGKVLVSERGARLTLLSDAAPGAAATRVEADVDDVEVAGEGGLMGLVVHPDFAATRRFTTCLNHRDADGVLDVRLVTWRLADDGRRAERIGDLLTGLPAAEGGRHSGCRPTIAADGALLVGTGDTADPTVPQDLTSLGGKVLRLDLETGQPLPDNPYADASAPAQRYVYSYGHRNIQGVAVQPGTGAVFTAEHGPAVNDEVNLIEPGANYGWDPSRGGTEDGYDESVPMTDRDRFPDAVPAVWESGDLTEAICGAAFLTGEQWGEREGRLVITALKGAKLLLLDVDGDRAVESVDIPAEIADRYGRLRAARTGPDGSLYVTTSNGSNDALLRITPAE